MCSNSLSVRTRTDWLIILSRDVLALCAIGSLPCGSHCLQRCTKVLEGQMGIQMLGTCQHDLQRSQRPTIMEQVSVRYLSQGLILVNEVQLNFVVSHFPTVFTWEEGSSWPELLFWKHIRLLYLQTQPESHGTSPPFSENWPCGCLWVYSAHTNHMAISTRILMVCIKI